MNPPWGTPYNGLYREVPPEGGSFFRLRVYEKVGVSLVKVYKRTGKFVIAVCERTYKGSLTHFMVVKKKRKLPPSVIYSCFKDGALQQLKWILGGNICQ